MDQLAGRLPPAPHPSMLMDLRPCYEGFAGIPQETRLLFALFANMGLGRLGGLASGIHFVTQKHRGKRDSTPFGNTLEQTRLLIAQDTKRHYAPRGLSRLMPGALRRGLPLAYMIANYAGRAEKLGLKIDPVVFEDYLWTRLFENTLAPSDMSILRRAEFFATEIGHENARHLSFLPLPFQRRIDTRAWDVFFGCTVSPYRVSPNTSMIIRYYDPLPLLSPHTVGEPWQHANSHARMLERNINQGATFFCGSEPIRRDLLRLFPQAEPRIHTIPCLVAPEFAPDVRPQSELKAVLSRRASPVTSTKGGKPQQPQTDGRTPRLIMAISTLEPRKNYLRLFRAFEIARRRTRHPIQLVVVANPGWRSEAELAQLKLLVAEGAHHLSAVPLPELRMLYSMVHMVVAPSRAEGFDYSGIEGMACGAPILASDTEVHRWVYGDAAEYVDGYDADAMADKIVAMADLPREEGKLADMRERGFRQAALYRTNALQPRWEQAVLNVARKKKAAVVG